MQFMLYAMVLAPVCMAGGHLVASGVMAAKAAAQAMQQSSVKEQPRTQPKDTAEQLQQVMQQMGDIIEEVQQLKQEVRGQQRESFKQMVQQARRDDIMDNTAAATLWDQRRFHAVHIQIKFAGDDKVHNAIGDTGAATGLISESVLSVEIINNTLRPGEARLLYGASAERIMTKGTVRASFQLGDVPDTFEQRLQLTPGADTPIILGVDFWVKHKAKFDFVSRCVDMELRGKKVSVPFTIGDEGQVMHVASAPDIGKLDEEQKLPLYSLQDAIVTGAEGVIAAAPIGRVDTWHCSDAWMVMGLQKDDAMREACNKTDKEIALEGLGGAAKPEEDSDYDSDEMDEDAMEGEEHQRAANTFEVPDSVERATWMASASRPCIPVQIVKTKQSDPIIIRKGDLVAYAERVQHEQLKPVAEDLIARVHDMWWNEDHRWAVGDEVIHCATGETVMIRAVHDAASDMPMYDIEMRNGTIRQEPQLAMRRRPLDKRQGTTSDGMDMRTEFLKDDWRFGRSVWDLIKDTQPGGAQHEAYQAWIEEHVDSICVEPTATEEEKSDYRRFAFIFRDAIAKNPKAPKALKGIEHQIVFEAGVDITPWIEQLRTSSLTRRSSVCHVSHQPDPKCCPNEYHRPGSHARVPISSDPIYMMHRPPPRDE